MLREITVVIPEPLRDRSLALPSALVTTIEASTRAISTLDSSHGDLLGALARLLLRTESVASSKIEQITANMDDYARALHGSKANAAAQSMVAATEATALLMDAVSARGQLSQEDLLGAHARLMREDPGERTYAGRLRDMQNWVGGSDHSPRDALLIPAPPELVAPLFADIIQFANRRDLPALLQAAIAHAQFETLHPFTDGNGRIGRAMINAILRIRGITSSIVVPLASALVARKDEYFQALNEFRDGDVEPILTSFTMSAHIAAEESETSARRIAHLPQQWRDQLGRLRRGSATDRLLELVLVEPMVTALQAEQRLGLRSSGTYLAIDRLVEAEILRPLTQRRRDQIWGASAVLDELDDLSERIESRARKA